MIHAAATHIAKCVGWRTTIASRLSHSHSRLEIPPSFPCDAPASKCAALAKTRPKAVLAKSWKLGWHKTP